MTNPALAIDEQFSPNRHLKGMRFVTQDILYQAPPLPIAHPQYRSLHTAMQRIGEPLVDINGKNLLSGMQIYDRITKLDDYPYPHADYAIYEGFQDFFADIMNGAIVIELGIGDRYGAQKLGLTVERIKPCRPAGLILNDQLPANTKIAQDTISREFGYDRNKIKLVSGDMFEKTTWSKINHQIDQINRVSGKPSRFLPVVVLLQSPTYNDFKDEHARDLQNLIFGASANNIIFCPAIDSTLHVPLLRRAYDNEVTLQFALLAVAYHCWSKNIFWDQRPFDPLKVRSVVDISPDKEGSASIWHVVERISKSSELTTHSKTQIVAGEARDIECYSILPIRKFPQALIEQKFQEVKTHILRRMPYKEKGKSLSSQLDYAVYAVTRSKPKLLVPGI